jgi:electron transfer flavoprotein alpha subunit
MFSLFAAPLRRVTTVSSLTRWNSTVVLSEALVGNVPAAPTLSAVTAALQLGTDHVYLLVIGGAAPTKVPVGVTSILHMQGKDTTEDVVKAAIEDAVVKHTCTHFIMTGSTLLPQIAKKLNMTIATDVVEIVSRETFLTGDDKVAVHLRDTLKVLGIRASCFDPAPIGNDVVEVRLMKDDSTVMRVAYKAMPALLLVIVAAIMLPE